jgi:SAM-dependent methyltransferase
MERREKLLAGINVQTSFGLEIGPLASPIVTRTEGPIVYVDHADSASLRAKYAHDPNVDVTKIVDVDAVWGEKDLGEAVGEDRKFDYILASHVIEHVPDLITWLEELRSVLNPCGSVRLVVPDRRFTFDYLRRETTLADVLYAYVRRARTPLPMSILDHTLNVAKVDAIAAWHGKLDPTALQRYYTFHDALSLAKEALETGTYHEVHCWVFTPRSFAALFEQAAELGLIKFECEAFFDTEPGNLEFIVRLRECIDCRRSAESWRRIKEAVREDMLDSEASPLADAREKIIRLHQETGRLKHRLITQEKALIDLTGRLMYVEREMAATRERQAEALRGRFEETWNARSWQLFEPIRNLIRRLHGTDREEQPTIYSSEEAEKWIRAIHESTCWELLGPLRALSRIGRALNRKAGAPSPKTIGDDEEGRHDSLPRPEGRMTRATSRRSDRHVAARHQSTEAPHRSAGAQSSHPTS